jgi:hypothetical protein
MVVMLLNDVRGAVNAVDKHINDPWQGGAGRQHQSSC